MDFTIGSSQASNCALTHIPRSDKPAKWRVLLFCLVILFSWVKFFGSCFIAENPIHLSHAALLGLLNHWSGVELLNIPKSPHSNPHGKKRWEQLTTVLGNHQAVEAFALAYGGATKFDIPTCSDLRKFRRNEAMRTRFDELIKKGFSSNQAVQDITIEFTPITTRQVQVILNSASHRS